MHMHLHKVNLRIKLYLLSIKRFKTLSSYFDLSLPNDKIVLKLLIPGHRIVHFVGVNHTKLDVKVQTLFSKTPANYVMLLCLFLKHLTRCE